MKIKVKKLVQCAKLPTFATDGDAGADLVATSISINDDYIEYGTGIAIEIPKGYKGEIFPRSSVSKKDLMLANSIGLIDSGYRGELKLRFKIVTNSAGHKNKDLPDIYKKGDRVGQLVITKMLDYQIVEADVLSDTDRGEGGFGSSGA